MLRLTGVSATEVTAVAEHLDDGGDAFLDAQNRRVEPEIEGLGVVVGCRDAGKVGDLAGIGPVIESTGCLLYTSDAADE